MGLFDNILSKSEAQGKFPWNVLSSESQLEALIQQSIERPIAFFKHSVRCGISSMMKDYLERNWDLEKESLPLYYLDLIRYRPISNKIASDLDVWHQSPQLILVKNEIAVYHASHQAINVDKMKQAIEL